jgi:thymidylate kinase
METNVAVAALIDSLATERVLVHGSLPPHGRDLDILVRPAEMERLVSRLPGLGFIRKDNELARFKDGSVELVDLAPSSWWQLPDDEVDALYADAIPLEGYDHLVRPAAHHMLLILTRRLVEGKGFLDEKRRSYVDRALSDDPGAWDAAARRAATWGARSGLELLRRMHETGTELSRAERAGAIAERLQSLGRAPGPSRVEAWRLLVNRPKRGRIVALSGVDGSGKSTQSEVLAETLVRLGFDAHAQWTKLGETPWIWRLARPVKKLLLALTRGGSRSALPPPSPDRYGPDAGTELRRRSPGLTQLWATVVALSNVLTHWRATQQRVLKGQVVVCDRYVLDSVVQLRARYGAERGWRFQSKLVRALSPKPLRAFLMEVPPDVAHERRRDEHDLAELTELVRLYDQASADIRVRRIDGARSLEDVAADLAAEVWLAL